jgi:hypothetical protein
VGWISPNARCPVCGASVYFYANQNGSRVFFDDVGPPWPKHPCTDNGAMPTVTIGAYRAPSRHDFSSAQAPGRLHDRRWRSYAIKGITFEGGYSRMTLQPLTGSGFGPARTVSGQLPLRADDLVFVHGQQMSYFDAASGEPVVVEDAGRVARIAQKLITERDKQHVLAKLRERVAASAMTPDEVAAVTEAVRAARRRGELARVLKIDVTDLKVAPPRPGDLLMLAIGFGLMVVATSSANGAPSFLRMIPGLLLGASAIYRLNPDMERGPRIMLAVMAASVMICPAGVVGGAI